MSSNKYQGNLYILGIETLNSPLDDEDVEVVKAMAEVSGSTDLLLMLQSQASSIEILLTNGY